MSASPAALAFVTTQQQARRDAAQTLGRLTARNRRAPDADVARLLAHVEAAYDECWRAAHADPNYRRRMVRLATLKPLGETLRRST